MKQILPHGEWNTWLKENVDFSPTTALNLLNIFDQYGADQLSIFGDNVKSEKYASLSYTQAVALLGVPEEQREDFIDENNIEKMSTRELQQAIKEKKLAEKKALEAEAASEKDRIARANLFETNQTLAAKQKENLKIQQKMEQEIENLKKDKTDPEVQKRLADLQLEQEKKEKELKAAQKEVDQLKKELKQKPIDAKTVEVVPAAVEEELEKLREQVSNQPTKISAKFEASFNQCVSNFADLEKQLQEVGKVDTDLEQNYKQAIVKLLDKMSSHLSKDDA